MNRRDLTDEEIYLQCAQREYETVAKKLEAVASRMRQIAERLPSSRQTAVGTAAEAMSEYTQGVGGIGTFLWGVVNAAEHLDKHRREAEGVTPS